MGDYKSNSLTRQLELLMGAQPDFPQRFKQRLVFELNKVTNHFLFIGKLLSKGVLCDGVNDTEGSFGLREMMVQLAVMVVCSKGADAIGGLMEAMEESGNLQLIEAIRTWVKEDVAVGTDCDLSLAKEDTSSVHTLTSGKLAQQIKSTTELSTSGSKLIDKVMSNIDEDHMEKLEGHLIGKASKLVNLSEFCSCLVRQNVFDESDVDLKFGPELRGEQWTEKVIKAACSKKAIGSLVVALQSSNNEHILAETYEWLETSPAAREKNYPVAVRSLANQGNKEESEVCVRSMFFEQAALPGRLTNLAGFKWEKKSATSREYPIQFDIERMMACSANGSLNLWNWRGSAKKSIKIAVKVKNITCFQYDQEMLVLGTAAGAVRLFDMGKFEEKSAVNLDGEPVISLKFFESRLVIHTRKGVCERLWLIDISRPDMRLLNRRSVRSWGACENQVPGVCMYLDTSFLYTFNMVHIYDAKSWELMRDYHKRECYLLAPAVIITVNVGDLTATERVVVAGCINGMIAMWNTSELTHNQSPLKTFQGRTEAIVNLCFLNGHLLSLDKMGRLLMWSGYDLESHTKPDPRVLMEYSNLTSLTAHQRWFASCSSVDDSINIWTVPDLWLRTG